MVGSMPQSVLYSNLAMGILVFFLLIFSLPLNPTHLGMPTWDTVLHTTISFWSMPTYNITLARQPCRISAR
jgi:K+-transporting ATPase A subunit